MSARVRVAFLVPLLCAGGAERVVVTLMNALDRSRFEPHLILLRDGGALRDLVAPDVVVHSLGARRVATCLPSLVRALWRIRPDVVFSTLTHMNFVVLAARPFLPRRMRVIVREANVPSSFTDEVPYPRLVFSLYRLLYPLADRVVSPAQIMIDEFRSMGRVLARLPHVLLRNPVAMRPDSQSRVAEAAFPVVRFLCAGRLHYQKGFDRLISALSGFSPSFAWELVVLGEGEERAALQSLIQQHGLEDRVRLAGYSSAVRADMARADAFLLPSRWEGLPNVALEALAEGTPVIAHADAGGIGEIAALAPVGAVQIASDMDAFLRAMAEVVPVSGERRSLLPDAFRLDQITSDLERLLEEVVSHS